MKFLPIGALYFGNDGICSPYPRGYGVDQFMVLPHEMGTLKNREGDIRARINPAQAETQVQQFLQGVGESQSVLQAQLIMHRGATLLPEMPTFTQVRVNDRSEMARVVREVVEAAGPVILQNSGALVASEDYTRKTLLHFMGVAAFSPQEQMFAAQAIEPCVSDLSKFPEVYKNWCAGVASMPPTALAQYTFEKMADHLFDGNRETAAKTPQELLKEQDKQDSLTLPWLVQGADKLDATAILCHEDVQPYILGATPRIYPYVQSSTPLTGDAEPHQQHIDLNGFCSAFDPTIYLTPKTKHGQSWARLTSVEERTHLLDMHLPLSEESRDRQSAIFERFGRELQAQPPQFEILAGMQLLTLQEAGVTPQNAPTRARALIEAGFVLQDFSGRFTSAQALEREGLPHLVILQNTWQPLPDADKSEIQQRAIWMPPFVNLAEEVSGNLKSAVAQVQAQPRPHPHKLTDIERIGRAI